MLGPEQVTIDDLVLGAVQVNEVPDDDFDRLLADARGGHYSTLARDLRVERRRRQLQVAGVIR